jgi:S-formylglutathione hydrolase
MLDGWSSIAIGGKSADVFDPPGALPFVLVYLHSLAEETPATDPAFTLLLKQHRLRCVAPRGGRSWWADRICTQFDATQTPERYLLDTLVPWAEAAWQLASRAIAIAGVEMGGQGAVRLAFKHPERFPIAASIAGAFDCQEWYGRGTPLDEMYENRERCRLDTAILHIDAHDWPPHAWFCCSPDDAWSYRGNDRLYEKLSAVGVPHTADLDTRAKSGVRYVEQMTPPMLAFVAGALRAEAKRLM